MKPSEAVLQAIHEYLESTKETQRVKREESRNRRYKKDKKR